jgi:hypothetical protein
MGFPIPSVCGIELMFWYWGRISPIFIWPVICSPGSFLRSRSSDIAWGHVVFSKDSIQHTVSGGVGNCAWLEPVLGLNPIKPENSCVLEYSSKTTTHLLL